MTNRWEQLNESFDGGLARRTAVMIKPWDGSRHFAYPADPGSFGYHLDEGMFAGYEEDPYLTIRIEPVYFPSYQGSFAAPSPVAWRQQTYRPDCIVRTALLPSAGFRVEETFCRPEDGLLLWRFHFRFLGDFIAYNKTLFVVISAPRLRDVRAIRHGFSFRPCRLPLEKAPDGRPIRLSANQGEDARLPANARGDGLAGAFPLHLGVDAADWGSYDTTEAYRDDLNRGHLNRSVGGNRHLVVAIRAEAEKPPASRDTDVAERHAANPASGYVDVTETGVRDKTVSLGLSFRSPTQARRALTMRDPSALIAGRWNRWLARLPPTKDRTPAARKAYDKCWCTVRLNRYRHPKMGSTVLEAPVYMGYWIWNLPTMDWVSRLDPEDRGHSFRVTMDAFCRAMNPGGVFPHAMYLKERTYGKQWGAAYGHGVGSIPNSAWAVMAYCRATGDRAALARWYPYLGRYYDFLCAAHDHERRHLWNITTLHDSFDTTPTSEIVRQHKEPYAYTPDYASERVVYERTMAAMARRLKRPADARRYAEAADRSLEALHRHLWDERAGWFGVRHADGTLDSRVGVPGLFPLAYGLATGRQARAARRPFERLLCRYGVRTFARGQRGYSETYWRGPVWATSILYGVAAARRYYPGLVGRIKEGLVSYCLAHPGIWELLEGDSGEVAATDYGFLAGVVYGGASMCGAAALIAATRILDGHNFFP